MTNKNINTLSGISCPHCSSRGPFNIVGTAVFQEITDDGCTEFSDMEWHNGSHIRCLECQKTGTVQEFTEPHSTDRLYCGEITSRVFVVAPSAHEALKLIEDECHIDGAVSNYKLRTPTQKDVDDPDWSGGIPFGESDDMTVEDWWIKEQAKGKDA